MKNNYENIEQEDKGIMENPFNPNNIKIQLQSIPIYLMGHRIEHREVNLYEDLQRSKGLWTAKQQSLFIESVLIRFPLPLFYFDGSEPNNWLVIDGIQRLTTLKRFLVTKELKLTGLEFLGDLEGKGYDDLDRPQQRLINETILQCYIIEEGENEVKFNIFKRINTGGITLTTQEFRHAIYHDVADYLKELANSKEFIDATNGKIDTERMLDRGFVNRFLAFYLNNLEKYYNHYNSLDAFMNHTLEILAKLSDEYKYDISQRFKKSMRLCKSIFGNTAFVKKKNTKIINKALFEVMSVNFAKLSDEERETIEQKKQLFKDKFYESIPKDFGTSLTSNTSGKLNVALRHKAFNNVIQEVLKS